MASFKLMEVYSSVTGYCMLILSLLVLICIRLQHFCFYPI